MITKKYKKKESRQEGSKKCLKIELIRTLEAGGTVMAAGARSLSRELEGGDEMDEAIKVQINPFTQSISKECDTSMCRVQFPSNHEL